MENWFIQGNYMLQSDAHGKKIETSVSVPDLPCSHLSPKSTTQGTNPPRLCLVCMP